MQTEREITVAEAMTVLRREFKKDPEPGGYRHGWICNLTECFRMSFMRDRGLADNVWLQARLTEGADNFLKRLEQDTTPNPQFVPSNPRTDDPCP